MQEQQWKKCEKLEKVLAWQLTKVRKKEVMKQGVKGEKFILRH